MTADGEWHLGVMKMIWNYNVVLVSHVGVYTKNQLNFVHFKRVNFFWYVWDI